MILGCIADDFTGATDLANNLVRAGMRVTQFIGVPAGAADITSADAVVIALKSRTAPVEQAVAESLAAARWLRGQGAQQIYFKVCSTFDSTDQGNIGPVGDALLDELQAPIAAICPAFPENGRTVFQGHLFVGAQLLSDSPMRHHPLTPMTDASLLRVMGRQSRHGVGLVPALTVRQGPAATHAALQALAAAGQRWAVVDAIVDDDLRTIATATATMPLIIAGSGVAIGIPACHGLAPSAAAATLPPAGGRAAVVSGSCSAATNAQVAAFMAAGHAAFALDAFRLAAGQDLVGEALAWAAQQQSARPEVPVLVYATAEPDTVRAVQRELGAEVAGQLVESALARIAAGLVGQGVGRLVVAGGETSGACVQALGIRRLRIGAQIAPGVPWCHAATALAGGPAVHIALKSGNFGGTDFFTHAFQVLA